LNQPSRPTKPLLYSRLSYFEIHRGCSALVAQPAKARQGKNFGGRGQNCKIFFFNAVWASAVATAG
jgi:hypothetical protein